MTRFLFSSLERSLQQGALSNAAAAVQQNRVLAAQKRSADQAVAVAESARPVQEHAPHRTAG